MTSKTRNKASLTEQNARNTLLASSTVKHAGGNARGKPDGKAGIGLKFVSVIGTSSTLLTLPSSRNAANALTSVLLPGVALGRNMPDFTTLPTAAAILTTFMGALFVVSSGVGDGGPERRPREATNGGNHLTGDFRPATDFSEGDNTAEALLSSSLRGADSDGTGLGRSSNATRIITVPGSGQDTETVAYQLFQHPEAAL
jgi:hypothetical protein